MKKPIVIWHEMDGAGDSSRIMVEQICSEAEEKFGICFQFHCMNITEFIQRLNHLEEEIEKPDVIFIPQDLVSLEKAKLSEVPEKYSQFMNEKIWNSMKYKGVQRGLPYLQGNHAVLYFNKKYFDKTTLGMEDIVNCNTTKYAFSMDLDVAYWLLPFLYTLNGNPVNHGKFYLNDQVKEKVKKYLVSLHRKNCLHDSEAIGLMLEEFIAGDIATMINGEWLYNYLLEQMGENIGVCELPEFLSNSTQGVSSSVGIAFPWNALSGPKQEALDLFITYMLSEDVQERWLRDYNRFPVNENVLEKFEQIVSDSNMVRSKNQMMRNYFLENDQVLKQLWVECDALLEEIKEECGGENYEN